MKYLILFNFIVSVTITGYFIYKYFPFYISVNRTFWCKRITSFTLMMYTHRGEYSSSAKGLFSLVIRNYKKADEWDSKMFYSGEYNRYNK